MVRLANLLRVGGVALHSLEVTPRTAVAAAADEPTAQAQVEHDQVRLDELRDAADRAQQAINDQFNALRDLVTTELNRRLRKLTEKQNIATSKNRGPDQLVAEIEAELQALDLELNDFIETRARRILQDATNHLGGIDIDVTIEARTGVDDVELDQLPLRDRTKDMNVRLRLATAMASAGSGAGVAGLYLDRAAWLVPLMGASLVVGLANAFTGARAARRERDLQAARAAIRAGLDQCRIDAGPRLRQAVLEIQREVESAVRSYVRQETRTLQQTITRTQKSIQADAATRHQIRSNAEYQIGMLDQLFARLEVLRTEVDAALT
jgi:hypothetical protein